MKQHSKNFTVVCIVSLMILGIVSLKAQSVNSVSSSIEPVVKGKKAGWVLEWKEVKNKVADLKWTIVKKRVDVTITETNSSEEATELLRQATMKIPVPPKAKLTGYGDEAYLYKMDKSDQSTILIKQDTLFIFVSSSHLDHAKEFATDICGVAKKAKKAEKD